jgi:NitT/TauT family transport system permease protein
MSQNNGSATSDSSFEYSLRSLGVDLAENEDETTQKTTSSPENFSPNLADNLATEAQARQYRGVTSSIETPSQQTPEEPRTTSVAEDLGRNDRHRQIQKRRARREQRRNILIRSVFIALLIAVWQAAHYILVKRLDYWSPAMFKSPLQVATWLWDGFGLSYFTGDFYVPVNEKPPGSFLEAFRRAAYPSAIVLSIWRLLQGYFIAVAIGFPLGLLVARYSLMERTVGWMAASLQSLPSICWIPIALLWFGRLDEAPILFVTILGALFATVVSVADGIRQVPPLFSRAGKTLGASGPRLYFSVLLPAALPGIVTGLKIGWAFAWRSLMAAELIVNSNGLGFLLERDRDNGDMEGVIASILVIIVIGLVVQELVFSPVQKRLDVRWGLNTAQN